MNHILKIFSEDTHTQKFIADLKKGQDHQLISGLSGSARPIFYQTIWSEMETPLLIVTPNLLHAQRVYDDLVRLMGEQQVHLYPAEELIAAEVSFSGPELRAHRIDTLDHMKSVGKGIYITPVAGMRKLLPTKEQWDYATLRIAEGEELDTDEWLLKLVAMGYSRTPMVTTPGEFALRGGILDVYPLNFEHPVRIELFDTEVDSLRLFSAEDQRSLEKVHSLCILPASELVLSKDQRVQLAGKLETNLAASLKKLKADDTKALMHQHIQHDINQLKQGETPEQLAKYASLIDTQSAFLGDYFPGNGLVFFDELGRIQEMTDTLEREEGDWIVSLLEEGKFLHDVSLTYTFREMMTKLEQKVTFLSLFVRTFPMVSVKKSLAFSCKPMQSFHGQMHLLKAEMERWVLGKSQIFIVAQGEERLEKVRSVLADYDMKAEIAVPSTEIQGGNIYLVDGELATGFEMPLQRLTVITDSELFKQQPKKKTRSQKLTNAERIKSYSEIKPGDYIVHIHHGIGRFIGIETLETGGVHKDYLHIVYKADDKLFVPVDKIDLIQKYVASEEKEPKLHKMGGAEWKKTRTKVSAAVQDIADDLIKLYAEREALRGFAFSEEQDMQRQFEAEFPYEETVDQLRSINEVKRDMENERPMDRLICGDVGYGKTEVAIRAAFKAVLDGKQVAFLVPTTILAQQHFETMSERFKDYPITVGLMSRFRSKKQQTETVKGLKNGSVDVVVGTHRILSKDMQYKDLGLLIIDEEQRFGVTHKEKIKQMKTNVDVLTLTATPIPRTLHMSMIGVRDLSVIETPPANRFPVQSYVMEHNGGLVREAIEREMARGGQVFYLYNRVDDMTRKVEEIQQLVPEARVGYAHGQMSETELESVILGFLDGDYDVLVTTTIIETGIDIPNVNTLIVYNADRMGLSQLYQLRGRVGRSSRVAYAYFMYQRDKVLTDVAEKRLMAIKEFTELGSGFKIAMRDLTIRGAGNLLGSQQHGFIDSVGFDLYSQMLQEAIDERQTGIKKEVVPEIEISLDIDAYIPDSYVSDGYQKIQMYKRVKGVDTVEEMTELQDELIDRFGDMPNETNSLLRIARMKVWARQIGVESIKQTGKIVTVRLSEKGTASINGGKVVEESAVYGRAVGFSMAGQQLMMSIDENKTKKQHPFDVLEGMMKLLPESLREEKVVL
ncbi:MULTISPECIES: transcription-repair coupling factor [Planococcus]|uniref:Transcription-repair-coupling factor n=1 Tax=Planococcus faecalis TaxID=1598147 RepID=A0ABM6IN81_9BACL|nr:MULTISPECIES: transcription-repair coupling factor [Planococcus]AQU77853.1 transcription-repair coupling factor [Planococcus faecalis]MDJ0333248.1 transcription-repair coupling factor [Planococcus sp. S3-L1]OHX54635.1 transcription-repair coupling factor [Planococcus faecalis]